MKALLLCLALLACYQVTATKTKKPAALLEYAVDDVLDALNKYRQQTTDEQTAADAAFQDADANFAQEIQDANGRLDAKQQECAAIHQQVAAGRQQEEDLRGLIQQAKDTLDANAQKAKDAADTRCATSLLNIAGVGDAEEAIEFLQYLRGRVADPEFADSVRALGSFAQIKAALDSKQEIEILSLIAKHHMLSTLQKKQYQGEDEATLSGELNAEVRTSDQVGTGYQDNDRGALEVSDISDDYGDADSNIQELLGYIDQLIAQLQQNIADIQEKETASVQAFIEYVRQLKDQNYVLEQLVAAAEQQLAELVAVDDNNQAAAEACDAQVPALEEDLASDTAARQAASDAHDQLHSSQDQRIQLLEEAIQVYTSEVLNVVSEAEKARADDYLDNQVFDSTSDFDARQALPQGPSL